MLTVSRIILRQLQQVLRKAGLLKSTRRKLSSSVRLYADHGGLTLHSQNTDVSVSLSVPGCHDPVELLLPMTCLLDCSQRTEGDVQFGQDNNKITAAWTDQGVPVIQEYESIAPADFPQIPALPTVWSENDAGLLAALAAAVPCTDPDSTRYAMGCLQLDGSRGQISATDGRQALVQRGFTFPWAEPVLIPACPIFTSPHLPRNETIHIGKTDQHVVLLIGSWTITLRIAEGRFPEVERIIPAETAVRTRVTLDPADAAFVAPRLKHLPQTGDQNHAVTLDLNGSVAIRSRPSSEQPPTELILSRSQWHGTALRLSTNRHLLQRAIDLGFTELGFTSADGPAVCRDGHREFVWALLDAESAVATAPQSPRLESLQQQPIVLPSKSYRAANSA